MVTGDHLTSCASEPQAPSKFLPCQTLNRVYGAFPEQSPNIVLFPQLSEPGHPPAHWPAYTSGKDRTIPQSLLKTSIGVHYVFCGLLMLIPPALHAVLIHAHSHVWCIGSPRFTSLLFVLTAAVRFAYSLIVHEMYESHCAMLQHLNIRQTRSIGGNAI